MAWGFYGEQANHDIVHSAWPQFVILRSSKWTALDPTYGKA